MAAVKKIKIVKNVPVYNGPGNSFNINGVLAKGQSVPILDYFGIWVLTEYGWINPEENKAEK